MKTELAKEGMNAAPPVAVAGSAWFFGLTLNDWVAIGTLTYLVIQTAYLAWRWYREAKGQK